MSRIGCFIKFHFRSSEQHTVVPAEGSSVGHRRNLALSCLGLVKFNSRSLAQVGDSEIARVLHTHLCYVEMGDADGCLRLASTTPVHRRFTITSCNSSARARLVYRFKQCQSTVNTNSIQIVDDSIYNRARSAFIRSCSQPKAEVLRQCEKWEQKQEWKKEIAPPFRQ